MIKIFPDPWANPLTEVLENIQTDGKQGLSEAEAAARLKIYGPNVFDTRRKRSLTTIFLEQFASPLIIILCLAVIITALLNEWLDTIIIAFAVIVNAIFGLIQEAKAEKAIDSLHSYITQRSNVIREGREYEIDSAKLVPGDVIHLKSGSRISVDARLLQEINLTTNESILTGESLSVEKQCEPLSETAHLAERNNMVYAGTLVVGGSGYAVVVATAAYTEVGKLAKLVDETEAEETPLQRALNKLTWIILIFTALATATLFLIGLWQGREFNEMLVVSIAVFVGSVPEALPIGLTSILAIGVERIAKRKGIIRNLTAAETLGSTTLIITDKTGTLTQANMQLKDIDTTEQLLAEGFAPSDPKDKFNVYQREILLLARSAADVTIENPEANYSDWKMIGSDLETNIVKAAALSGITQDEVDRSQIQIRIPFSSKYKFSVVRIPSDYLPNNLDQFEDPHVVMGAPDIIIDRSYYDEETKQKLRQAVEKHSEHGRRVLGIGLLTPHVDPDSITTDHVKDVTFIGVLSFYDPVRPEVLSALKKIKTFNTKVVMATGDLPGTALAVARELGWQVTKNNLLTGSQLRQIDDNELLKILPRTRIFARVTPEDKLRITRLQQKLGEVVAMTGDGVNDAPALKAANIGVAVGSGSDVAKSVADLILLDDNFKTIVATIEEGKQILDNIKKMFVYLMSNALDELILIGGSILVGATMPLTAIQIIWVNLFTGSLPAIAFAFDKQRMREIEDSSRQFFSPRVVFLTIFVGFVVSMMLLLLYLYLIKLQVPFELSRSIIFASFGSYTLFIAFSFLDLSRPIWRYSIIKNKVLLAGVGVGVFLLTLTFFLPFARETFSVVTLPLPWIGFVIFWIILNLVIVEVSKWVANTFIEKLVDKKTKLS